MVTIDLGGRWRLSGDELNRPVPARVPGCVHTDLLRERVIKDPYYRDRELGVQWIGRADWTWTRTFNVPTVVLEEEYIVLECEGLDTLAEVRINRRRVGTADNMFRSWEFDVAHLLEPGENTVEIRFKSPLPLVEKRQKERPLPAWWFRGGGYIRKEYCNFGWDWAPTLVTSGIWRPIRIRAWSEARIADVRIRQNHVSKRRVGLDIGIDVESDLPPGLKADVFVSLGGKLVASCEDVAIRSNRGKATVTITDAKLWWPNGLGDQPLYDVAVRLRNGEKLRLGVWERRIGLRTLRLSRRKDKWGESFEFLCNGTPFFAKGANWIPADTFAARVRRPDYRRLLSDAALANMNMLRVWGGGHYENDDFYQICDELGICVWQDFMFACGTYPTFDDGFMENVEAEARENVARLRHHACIALWCGNNELEQGLVDDEWTGTSMSWKDYGKLFDGLLAKVCSELAPDTDYWPGSPHTPVGDRRDWNDPASGDAHLWDVWHGRKPFEWYYGCRHRFVSEFGFQSFPHPRTVRGYTLPEDRNVTSPVMEHHQRSGAGNTLIMTYMLDWFRMPKDFESTLWLSQLLQAFAIRALVEQLRRNMPRSMGALYWQLNDCWPVASWASIDGAGRWKALHHIARRFYAPRLVSAVEDPQAGTAEIHVTSDPGHGGAATVRWYATTSEGKTVDRGTIETKLPNGGSKRVTTLKLAALLEKHGHRNVILWLEMVVGGKTVSTNYALFARPKQMNIAPTSSISVATKVLREGTFRVTLKSKKPVLWAWLDHRTADLRCGDNFVCLRPGKTVTIDVEPARDLTAREFKSGLVVRSLRDTW